MFGINIVSAEIDTLNNIEFLQTGVIETNEVQFYISSEISDDGKSSS